MNRLVILFVLLFAVSALAQTAAESTDGDISGMYTFLHDGEFVEIDVHQGNVTGYVSRNGELPSDKGAFLDHVFKSAELNGNHLHFVTREVHGVWFEFDGTATRGDQQDPNKEGFRLLKGKLTQYTDTGKDKPEAKSRDLTMKSFPMDEIIGKSR